MFFLGGGQKVLALGFLGEVWGIPLLVLKLSWKEPGKAPAAKEELCRERHGENEAPEAKI